MSEWLLWLELTAPRLEPLSASGEPDGYRVRMLVANAGRLTSYGSKMAPEKKVVRPLCFPIEVPEDAWLVSGKERQEAGQLEGPASKPSAPVSLTVAESTGQRPVAEWIVQAPQGGTVRLEARHERAGPTLRDGG